LLPAQRKSGRHHGSILVVVNLPPPPERGPKNYLRGLNYVRDKSIFYRNPLLHIAVSINLWSQIPLRPAQLKYGYPYLLRPACA
jgi:hypothetical protein